MDGAEALRAREEEVGREWEWLNEAINLVARARAEDETDNAFRLLQQQRRVCPLIILLQVLVAASSRVRFVISAGPGS